MTKIKSVVVIRKANMANASGDSSTRQQLLASIDDIELIAKELIRFATTNDKPGDIDISQVLSLLFQKDREIKEKLVLAEEQAELQEQYDALKAEVDKRDVQIKELQRSLKEAESILSTAIYQAQHKLDNIHRAAQKRISSEELIKYAHKVSACNAVAAPATWAPGDPRRPYPTELQMRAGILAKFNEMMSSSTYAATQGAQMLSDILGHSRPSPTFEQNLLSSTLSHATTPPLVQWQNSVESSSSPRASSHPYPLSIDTRAQTDSDDFTMRSSDSSSSTSSDE